MADMTAVPAVSAVSAVGKYPAMRTNVDEFLLKGAVAMLDRAYFRRVAPRPRPEYKQAP